MSYYGPATQPATQAEMEASASPLTMFTPSNAKWWPGIAKAWVAWTPGGTTIQASFGVTSISRSGAGIYTVNFSTNFSSAHYCALWSIESSDGSNWHVQTASLSASAANVYVRDTSGGVVDPLAAIIGMFWGDQ